MPNSAHIKYPALSRRWTHALWPLLGRHFANVLLTCSSIWVLALWSTSVISWIRYHVTYFDGPAIDGAFQLLDPLRRLAAGQTPGVDFPFFHGLGTLLLHYPLFWAFGRNLFASELSRQILSPALFVLTAGVLIYVVTRRLTATLLGLAVLALFHPILDSLATTGVSLLGVRSALPLLVGAAIVARSRLNIEGGNPAKQLAVPILLGLAVAVSTEQGLVALLAFVTTQAIFSRRSPKTALRELGIDMAVAVATALLFFLATSGTRFWMPIAYAIRDVPSDQFWYFGAPPNSAFYSLRDVATDWPLVLPWICGLAALVLVARSRRWLTESRGLIFLLIYGLGSTVSILGTSSLVYVQPLVRVSVLVAFCYGWLFIVRGRLHVPRLALSISVVVVAPVLVLVSYYEANSLGIRPMAAPKVSGPKVSGTHLSPAWRNHLEVVNEHVPQAASLWSTYTGLAEATRGTFNPSGYDYMIHALGKEHRDDYLKSFLSTRPDYVNTIRRGYVPYGIYEEWLETSDWSLYENLLLNYQWEASSPFSNIWRKESEWHNPKDLGWLHEVSNPPENVTLDKLPIDLPDGTIVTVEVDYKIRNPFGGIPVLGKLPRYFVAAYDSENGIPASLPPYETTWEFPVITRAGQLPRMYFYTGSLTPGARLTLTALRYRVLSVPETTRAALLH